VEYPQPVSKLLPITNNGTIRKEEGLNMAFVLVAL
jgi:hypothetical protein